MSVRKITVILAVLIGAVPAPCWSCNEAIDPIDRRLEECINKYFTTAGSAIKRPLADACRSAY